MSDEIKLDFNPYSLFVQSPSQFIRVKLKNINLLPPENNLISFKYDVWYFSLDDKLGLLNNNGNITCRCIGQLLLLLCQSTLNETMIESWNWKIQNQKDMLKEKILVELGFSDELNDLYLW